MSCRSEARAKREWLEGLSVEEQEFWLAERDRELQRQADAEFDAGFAEYEARQYCYPEEDR